MIAGLKLNFMIIHVENTFRAMTGEICGRKSQNTFKNIMDIFFFPVRDIKILEYFTKSKILLFNCKFSQ